MSMAIYAGSFDPITVGHIDIIERAAILFSKLIIAVGTNNKKVSLWTREKRIQMITEAVPRMLLSREMIEVVAFDGMLIDYAMRFEGPCVLLRGLRAVSDFEAELQMAQVNRELSHGKVETLLMMTQAKRFFVSSSIVKAIMEAGGDASSMVPESVAKAIDEWKEDLPRRELVKKVRERKRNR